MIHELKCDYIYFEKIWDGKKKSELRLDDRGYRQNHHVLLKEYLSSKQEYTGREIKARISYVTGFPKALMPGFLMICLDDLERLGG